MPTKLWMFYYGQQKMYKRRPHNMLLDNNSSQVVVYPRTELDRRWIEFINVTLWFFTVFGWNMYVCYNKKKLKECACLFKMQSNT